MQRKFSVFLVLFDQQNDQQFDSFDLFCSVSIYFFIFYYFFSKLLWAFLHIQNKWLCFLFSFKLFLVLVGVLQSTKSVSVVMLVITQKKSTLTIQLTNHESNILVILNVLILMYSNNSFGLHITNALKRKLDVMEKGQLFISDFELLVYEIRKCRIT